MGAGAGGVGRERVRWSATCGRTSGNGLPSLQGTAGACLAYSSFPCVVPGLVLLVNVRLLRWVRLALPRRWLAQHRSRLQAGIDVVAWAIALSFATVVRYDFNRLEQVNWRGLSAMIAVAGLGQLFAGAAVGLYRGQWRFGSFEEVLGVAKSVAITTGLVFVSNMTVAPPHPVPISASVSGGLIALVGMVGARYVGRLALESARRPSDQTNRIIVFGAGDGASQVVTAMLSDPDSTYYPVALLDDDRRKRNLRIRSVRVLGNRNDLADVAERVHASCLLIAIPSAGKELVAELTDLGLAAGLEIKVLPPVSELFRGGVGIADIRDVTLSDLLGRDEIEIDVDSIAGYLTGKRVLVTGAGGSIGSELCRQIHRYAPAALILLDRDESALHAVQLSIEGRALLDSPDLVLLDIRDRVGVGRLFEERRPEVVFHAAALKHVSLLERFPGEAVKSNVWGTLAVLEAAARSGVQRFVNISSDKAADACCVLGYSKRIAERLTAAVAADSPGIYVSVRFGNVLGSRGSVLESFRAQIGAGGPLTVTHPDVTRYFMTVHEAVKLVIQAAAIGDDAEALVLDMGDRVRIADLAERMAATASRPLKLVYTGLRPGEKLHEVLWGTGEEDRRPIHPLISHVDVPPLCVDEVQRLDPRGPGQDLIEHLRQLSAASSFDRSLDL